MLIKHFNSGVDSECISSRQILPSYLLATNLKHSGSTSVLHSPS